MPRQLRTFYEGELGQYFRGLRENQGWSLRQAVRIAEERRLPVTLGALRWLEGGFTKNPEAELIQALAKLYGESYGTVVQEVARHVFAIEPHELLEGAPPPTSVEGFVALRVLATPIKMGQALRFGADPGRDTLLSFRHDFVKRFTRPVALRVGRREASMTPTIEPNDVVLIDQNVTRRRRPRASGIYAVNTVALTGDEGSVLHRVELAGRTLILTSDHPDKTAYPTHTLDIKSTPLADVLVGEVVWCSRSLVP